MANLLLAGVLAGRGGVTSPGDVVGSQDEGVVPAEIPSEIGVIGNPARWKLLCRRIVFITN